MLMSARLYGAVANSCFGVASCGYCWILRLGGCSWLFIGFVGWLLVADASACVGVAVCSRVRFVRSRLGAFCGCFLLPSRAVFDGTRFPGNSCRFQILPVSV